MKETQLVTIIKQDHFGNGIAKVGEMFTFVTKALPGEVCEVEVVEKKKNFQRAKILELIQSSSERVKPVCPYYGVCGGCSLQHQDYSAQLQFKETKVKELLERFAGYTGKVEPIRGTKEFHYRNKVTLKVNDGKLSYCGEKSHDFISIQSCFLLPDKMNCFIKKLQEYLNQTIPFQEVQIRMNQKDEFLLSIEGRIDQELLLEMLKDFSVIVIYQNHQVIYGKDDFSDCILGMNFYLSDTSFFQVNRYQTETLYQLVLDEVKKFHPKKLLDLYCGTGTLGLLASRYCDEVIGVEVVESAVRNAIRNQKENGIENATFYLGKVEDKINDFSNSDFIIVDPPRRGLDEKTKKALLRLHPEVICYVSCDPVTLARDLKELQKKYTLQKVTPVDMFPNTYHVECVCLLKIH